MSSRLNTEDKSFQIARLRRVMQQADAQWEELTRSIQAHQECLTDVRQRLEYVRLALTLHGEQPCSPTFALETRLAALHQQIARLEQQVSLANARRSAVTRQFEQARLDLAALRRPTPQQKPVYVMLARKLLIVCLLRPLRFFWSALQQSGAWSEVIPNDVTLKNRS